MWKPNESLDDYVVNPAPEVLSEPPHPVSLRRTGEVEVLKPVIRVEVRSKSGLAFGPSVSHQPLWFRRFLAVGSGALVLIALVLVSAVLVGINDPAAEPDVVTIGQSGDTLTQSTVSFDIFSPSTDVPAISGIDIVRSHRRRRAVRPFVHLAAYKPRPQSRPSASPQPEQPKFVPTTLVIYAENGIVYTRIEPWLQASNQKKPTFDN